MLCAAIFLSSWFALAMTGFAEDLLVKNPESAADATIRNLRCEYLKNPLGIDVEKPRLSWVIESARRGERQTAYHVLVASTPELLAKDQGDLWDSGRVESDQSIQVEYAGKPLASRTRCHWKVRAWDKDGKVSAWSEPALWTMGLLRPEDWQGAKWIGLEPVLKATPEEFFLFELTEKKTYTIDRVVLHNCGGSDNYYSKDFSVQVSESDDPTTLKTVISGTLKAMSGPQTFKFAPVAARQVKLLIHSGYRSEFVELGEFEVYSSEGKNVVAAKEGGRLVAFGSQQFPSGDWSAERINDGVVAGASGSWSSVASNQKPIHLSARYLRREFTVDKAVKRATVHLSGIGESDLFLNGRKVGDHLRDPGMTMWTKRVQYVTFDVTGQMQRGANAVGVIIGNGRYFGPRPCEHFGCPKLLLRLDIEFEDGTAQNLVSDEYWKVTDQGPIRANNEYDGEEYDARMELPKWDLPGYDDSAWQKVQLLKAPGGRVAARMYPPMRVVEVLKPVAVTNPDPGVYIVDMGQAFYGTVRLKVAGPAGTRVQMRSTFSLYPNGRLNVLNQRTAKTTDVYILKGQGQEQWQPRFRGQGYRYVEVTGFPGKPTADNFEGLFIHDDLEETGRFECSHPLINRLERMMRYDQMGQKRSGTLDPDRDERQSFLGGGSAYAECESTHHNVAPFYNKWLLDIRLDQRDDGALSDVSPAYWQCYSRSLVWPADVILVPQVLHKYYGDRRVLEENFGAMKKWVISTLPLQKPDGTVDHDQYGDWCDAYSMDGKAPMTGATSMPLIATAYFYNNCTQLARIAGQLGKKEDQIRFGAIAEKTHDAFLKRFFDPKTNTFQGKTHCSYVLPLAFGLVPEPHRNAVVANLADDIMVKRQQHLWIGLVGMIWAMRTLDDVGRTDVAYAVATQTTRPSWGYMVAKGASGMWERWDQDTQGPEMNGQGFLMLAGDLDAWFYQGLAGIQPDPERPGFKHVILKPQPVGDLKYVRASYMSMHGLIVSDWKIENGKFLWNVTVPANATAKLYIPARNADSVTEAGKSAGQVEGLKFLHMENGAAVYEAGSGRYAFVSERQ